MEHKCFQSFLFSIPKFVSSTNKSATITHTVSNVVNSLPNDKILDQPKFKTFADDKINVTEKLKFVSGRVENILGKGENADYHHFSPFPTMFSKGFFYMAVKNRECVVKS